MLPIYWVYVLPLGHSCLLGVTPLKWLSLSLLLNWKNYQSVSALWLDSDHIVIGVVCLCLQLSFYVQKMLFSCSYPLPLSLTGFLDFLNETSVSHLLLQRLRDQCYIFLKNSIKIWIKCLKGHENWSYKDKELKIICYHHGRNSKYIKMKEKFIYYILKLKFAFLT